MEDSPPLSLCPVLFPFLSQMGAKEALDLKVCSLNEKGAVEEVLSQGLPSFYSWLRRELNASVRHVSMLIKIKINLNFM